MLRGTLFSTNTFNISYRLPVTFSNWDVVNWLAWTIRSWRLIKKLFFSCSDNPDLRATKKWRKSRWDFWATSSVLWHYFFYPFFWNQDTNITKTELSSDHKNFYLQSVEVTIRVEQPFQHVSWTTHMIFLFLARVSTISLAIARIVPTLRDVTRSLNLFL